MNRKQLLAAETFAYSYANYADHLGIGNIRFDKLMPGDVDTLEQAEQEGWDDKRLAEALEVEEEDVDFWRISYQRAKEIVGAIEEGLSTEEDIKALVTQICYRTADLAYLLDLEGKQLSDYSGELRKEPDVQYSDE